MTPGAMPAGAAARVPARLLVLGGGGREHALVWSLAREAAVEAVLVAPGSDAIGGEPKARCFPQVSAVDAAAVQPNMRVFVQAGKSLNGEVEAYQVIWGRIMQPE